MNRHRLGLTALLIVWTATLCGAGKPTTWQVIQQQILDQNCISCHASGTSFARQSGLVLTADQAYGQLVDVPPTNPAARADGLLRISSVGGFPGLFQSFLWEKIHAQEQEHFYQDHPDYGAQMPLGGPALTNGQLALVRNWILQGAPQVGSVVDTSLLADTTRYEPPEFRPLDPPQQGIQLHLGPFEVWPAEVHDREFLYFQPYQTDEDLFIQRYEISYRPGSHHFILYHYADGKRTPRPESYRDLRNQNGTINPLVGLELSQLFPDAAFIGSQVPYMNYQFPEGVALRLPKGSGFDFDVHSVNRTDEPRVGEVYVNLHTAAAEDIQHIAEVANFGNFDIRLPPHDVTTLSKTFTFDHDQKLVQMWSHAHEHMVEFRVERVGGERDGELLYWTNDWEHPPIMALDPPMTFHEGDRVQLVTTYRNDTDRTIRFGPLSSDEMQFLFYISYPYDRIVGDFDDDGQLNVNDIDRLTSAVRSARDGSMWDLNGDGAVDHEDRRYWVEQLKGTYFGDADLNGEFGTGDLVKVFQTGEYEDTVSDNSTWSDGDWNGDGEFGTGDLVLAFQSGGFEQGPRQLPLQAVPEPVILPLTVVVAILFLIRRRSMPQRHLLCSLPS